MKTVTYSIAQTPVLIYEVSNKTQTVYITPEAQDIYIGGADLTVNNGIKLTKSVMTPIEIRQQQELYAICKTGTHPVVLLVESP